jgi:peptidyl-prolyl cis-trans isomerase B (cyclophilin B)
MIQGGDPLGNGRGGSDNPIRVSARITVMRTISPCEGHHIHGRAPSSYNSATSQFFIVHEDSTFLDGEYAAFAG